MALLFTTQTAVQGPLTIGPGVRMSFQVISINATVTGFTVVSPFDSLLSAEASPIGSASTTAGDAVCGATMSSNGYLTLGTGKTVPFTKNNTTQTDYQLTFLGA